MTASATGDENANTGDLANTTTKTRPELVRVKKNAQETAPSTRHPSKPLTPTTKTRTKNGEAATSIDPLTALTATEVEVQVEAEITAIAANDLARCPSSPKEAGKRISPKTCYHQQALAVPDTKTKTESESTTPASTEIVTVTVIVTATQTTTTATVNDPDEIGRLLHAKKTATIHIAIAPHGGTDTTTTLETEMAHLDSTANATDLTPTTTVTAPPSKPPPHLHQAPPAPPSQLGPRNSCRNRDRNQTPPTNTPTEKRRGKERRRRRMKRTRTRSSGKRGIGNDC